MNSFTMNSINDYTHFALDIKDENIIFTAYQEEIRGGRRAKVYYGTLKATAQRCSACGFPTLVHNGSAHVSVPILVAVTHSTVATDRSCSGYWLHRSASGFGYCTCAGMLLYDCAPTSGVKLSIPVRVRRVVRSSASVTHTSHDNH